MEWHGAGLPCGYEGGSWSPDCRASQHSGARRKRASRCQYCVMYLVIRIDERDPVPKHLKIAAEV